MIARAAAGCMPVLDGVLQGRNHVVEIRRQLAAPFNRRPQRHGGCGDHLPAERDHIKVVVEVRPPAAMVRIASLPDSRSAILPSTRATDIVAAFASEEHVSTSIEALGVPL